METILLLFMLSTLEKDPSAKQQISSFLKFYRENRELITALTGNAQQTQQQESPKQENRPSPAEKDGNLKILEEYLAKS